LAVEDHGEMAGTYLQLLGRFQVRRGGEEIPPAAFGGRKVRTLLRVLAVRCPDLVPHEALADALWPDRLPADPAGNLGVLVNRARRALCDPALIVTGSGGYALGMCTVDVAEFLSALARARDAVDEPAVALRAATAALALWAEPLAEDTYAEWAREPRSRLLRARVDALEIAARAALALGDPSAVATAADAVAAEPLRESTTLVLARALAAAGNRAAALRRLAELRERLVDDLGVDPSTEFTELQMALLRGELPEPPRIAVPSPTQPRAAGFTDLIFVGRETELARLRAAVAAGQVATLSGVSGVGKSRLLAEMLRGSTLPLIAARAFLPERAEAWGLARSLLREAVGLDSAVADGLPRRVRDALASLLPELDDRPATTLDGESRRALILAGALRILEAATGSGAVLVVDDLQWADPSSLALLGSALARLPRLAAVLAYRPDELDPAVLAALREARPLAEITLGPLPPDAVTGLTGDPGLAAALVTSTDGTPFALAEVLRELLARDAVTATPTGWTPRDSATIDLAGQLGREGQRRAVRRRAQRQTGARSEVLVLLALLARETPARTLAAAAGLDSRTTLDVLSALATDGLVRLGEQGWATAHDVVSETITAGIGGGERGRLHGLLAAALEAEDADQSEVARHHRESGDTSAAARAFERAAHRALAEHATREAAALADSGLALSPRSPARAGLLDARAEARAAHGDLAGALADLHNALADSSPGPARSRRFSRLAMLTSGAQDPLRAAELAELALVEAGEDSTTRAVALETLAILDMNLGRPDRARNRSEEALALHRRLGDAQGVARILDGRAMATFLDGHISRAVEMFGRAAQLFEDAGELLRVVTPRSTLGHGLVFRAQPADGLTETTAALLLARDIDAPEGQAYALWHRSEALSGLGRGEEAEDDAREALRIAVSIDHRGWTATAYRALGIAMQSLDRLDDAAAAFQSSAAAAGDTLTLFASWAAARSALVALKCGSPAHAARHVKRALALGPPLGHYEARLAEVELAAALGADDVSALAAKALTAAQTGGHLVSVPQLAELANDASGRDRRSSGGGMTESGRSEARYR
jgi:DNA-binding SARP family transcriptional activator/tetratricopeptide (TPR) repeat protein